jgi:hypothetical protein
MPLDRPLRLLPARSRRHLLAAAAATALLAGLPWRARAQSEVEIAGVKFPTAIDLAHERLLLNGWGIRYKAIFKVYAAALYLPAKTASPDAVFRSSAPRRLHVVMLRDIDARELGKLFTKAMEENASHEEFAPLIPGTIQMGEIFAARRHLAAGEGFTIDWIPGRGTVISVEGKPQGEPIKEPQFFTVLMRIWLGDHPADAQLKDALLGHPRPSLRPGDNG